MSNPHDAFKALGVAAWATDFDPDNEETARQYATDILVDSQSLIDSIPAPENERAKESRAITDTAKALRKEWKEVKVKTQENPLGVTIYKLSSKDSRGAWFARRSIHEGLSFDKWKLALEKEFAETMKPGVGNIRGIGAQKRVEHRVIEGCANIQVYQLAAQFPSVSPRDFITMMITSDTTPEQTSGSRQFMVVSKPCNHPECPQQQGYVRGYYESAEFIREIKVEKPLRKTRSSIDVSNIDGARKDLSASQPLDPTLHPEQEYETKVEWLMVTRSDPGGSIPRFLVERGTPGGIAGDAQKLLQWALSVNPDSFEEVNAIDSQRKGDAKRAHETAELDGQSEPVATTNLSREVDGEPHQIAPGDDEQRPAGFYNIISGAVGAAASYIQPHSVAEGDDKGESSVMTESDTESSLSFHSIEDDEAQAESPQLNRSNTAGQHSISGGSTTGPASGKGSNPTRYEKEIRKLEARRLKHQEKMQREEEAALARRAEDSKRDESEMAKLQEKHAKERSRREDKYQRELQRLEDKRKQEERKKEVKAKKTREKEERKDLSRELEKCRTERDMALKQVEVLKAQLGELQRENTTLVMKLGTLEGGDADEMMKGLTGDTNTLDLAGNNKKEHKKKGSEAKRVERAGGIQRSQTTDVIPK